MSKENTYIYPRETWSADKCRKLANRCTTDAFGNKEPKGWLKSPVEYNGAGYGYIQVYNGGCVGPDGKYYPKGKVVPVPVLAEGYEIRNKVSWGQFIVNINNSKDMASTEPLVDIDKNTGLLSREKTRWL